MMDSVPDFLKGFAQIYAVSVGMQAVPKDAHIIPSAAVDQISNDLIIDHAHNNKKYAAQNPIFRQKMGAIKQNKAGHTQDDLSDHHKRPFFPNLVVMRSRK